MGELNLAHTLSPSSRNKGILSNIQLQLVYQSTPKLLNRIRFV